MNGQRRFTTQSSTLHFRGYPCVRVQFCSQPLARNRCRKPSRRCTPLLQLRTVWLRNRKRQCGRRPVRQQTEGGREHEKLELVHVAWNWQPVAWPNDGWAHRHRGRRPIWRRLRSYSGFRIAAGHSHCTRLLPCRYPHWSWCSCMGCSLSGRRHPILCVRLVRHSVATDSAAPTAAFFMSRHLIAGVSMSRVSWILALLQTAALWQCTYQVRTISGGVSHDDNLRFARELQ